jgi:uncharacterized protein (DUF1778 family)
MEFRLPSKLKQQIERAAAVQNRSVTEFATSVLAESSEKVLAEHSRHEHVVLSDRDRERFLAMLDADPSPNAALRAAVKRYRKRVA